MTNPVLHYIHDPLCGWCWGAAPLVRAASAVLPLRLHGGGMMAGAQRQPVTPELRGYVMAHDQRIAEASGQPFGAPYRDVLLRDGEAVFDSEPPTAAILAADALGGRGLHLLAELQAAHYVQGRRIAEPAVLVELAGAIGLAEADFADELARQSAGPVQTHIQQTRAFMARTGVRGFPGFILETPAGLSRLDAMAYLGRPLDFAAVLQGLAGQPPVGPDDAATLCAVDGCTP
ncbi:DsbA family protein [Roseateles sp. LYH14W]|uniref:DsbA family protein n=1 Tax=Pelomonas parva TaxID=3299032 RepID=A0ABW7EWQ5_9BURK